MAPLFSSFPSRQRHTTFELDYVPPPWLTTTVTPSPPDATPQPPDNSRDANIFGTASALVVGGVLVLCVLGAVYYYFHVHRERLSVQGGVLAPAAGGRGPATIHVMEGVPMDYSAVPAAGRRRTGEDDGALQRLPQASAAAVPTGGDERVTYHVRLRGRSRRVRVRATDAEPHVFNPLALAPASAEAQACIGRPLWDEADGGAEQGSRHTRDGQEKWMPIHYGSAVYYSRPVESQHLDASRSTHGNRGSTCGTDDEDDEDAVFRYDTCDSSAHQR
ncbi:hypothetical protein NESM_000875700 [Novymonas esmeraldas]|uniref:Uncharacterized protein n=1 Tax=Novymonas esmeraldas TaxID=1808958 RepID=A0AAW0F0F9_9TRYP